MVELAPFDHPCANDRPHRRGHHGAHEMFDGLRMKIAAEALELRAQQDCVRVVDLCGGISASPTRSTDGSVGSHDLVQGGPAQGPPVAECDGRHLPNENLPPAEQVLLQCPNRMGWIDSRHLARPRFMPVLGAVHSSRTPMAKVRRALSAVVRAARRCARRGCGRSRPACGRRRRRGGPSGRGPRP